MVPKKLSQQIHDLTLAGAAPFIAVEPTVLWMYKQFSQFTKNQTRILFSCHS